MLSYRAEGQQGKMLRICCSDGRNIITDQWEEALAFLLQPTDMGIVWNVDEFVDAITSIMPKDLAKKVKQGGRVITPDNRKLYYQPNRMFGINYINFYSLQRYSDERIDDPTKLLELADKVTKAYETFGVEVTTLSSPIGVYSQIMDSLNFPRACDLPDNAFDLIQKCSEVSQREWRDVYKLGHFEADEISDFDVVACYPSIVAKLPDISHATFFESKTMPDKYSWGLLYGKLRIDKDVSPFICQERNCYGKGEWPDLITSEQLWLLEKYELGSFNMEQGWFFLLPKIYGYPFKATMERLYKQRDSDNPIVSKIAKAISVGLVGKFAERHADGLGDNFNSIYSKMATSRCMVKVASFIYKNHCENDLVSVLVDGFMATKRLALENKKKMGSWRINPSLPALVLSLEYQWQGEKRPAYQTYKSMIELIKRNPNKPNYGDVDMNLIQRSRNFAELPHTGGELLASKYHSIPFEIHID